MALRMGEIVRVLVEGYGVPKDTLAAVIGFDVSGVRIGTPKWGQVHKTYTAPAFALRKVHNPQAEMIWNRIRHKEDMILRAMRRWGVTSILIEPTDVTGEIFKVTVAKHSSNIPVRARTMGEALKMAFMLGYFLRFSVSQIYEEQTVVLKELAALREEVRAL